MEKICIDYTTAIRFLNGDLPIVEKLRYYALNEQICLSPITVSQLLATVENTELLSGFISKIVVLPFGERAAHISAEIIKELHKKGLKKNLEDIITASVCKAENAFLFTINRKLYEGISGLKIV